MPITDTSPQIPTLHRRKTLLALTAILGALAVVGCSKHEESTNGIRTALAYKIGNDAGTATDAYSGDIRARHETDHAFRVGGKLVKRAVEVGTSVKRGQTLAQIDPQDVNLAADAARAQVVAQATESEFADAELHRFRDLFVKGFVSQSALDQKINAANAARARMNAQQAQAKVSLNQAGYATLVAELDGVVTQVLAEAGQVVAAGQPVVRIANPREKELVVGIPESQIGEFNRKSKGVMMAGLWSSPTQTYPAKVREISAAADPVTRTYAARISLPSADAGVQLGMSGYVAFVGARGTGEISVPLSALYVRETTTGVWQIASDGKISLKAVTVVKYTETAAIIKSATNALKSGDLIVAAGVHKLREGDVVKPVVDPVVTGDGKVAMAAPAALPGESRPSFAEAKRFLP